MHTQGRQIVLKHQRVNTVFRRCFNVEITFCRYEITLNALPFPLVNILNTKIKIVITTISVLKLIHCLHYIRLYIWCEYLYYVCTKQSSKYNRDRRMQDVRASWLVSWPPTALVLRQTMERLSKVCLRPLWGQRQQVRHQTAV